MEEEKKKIDKKIVITIIVIAALIVVALIFSTIFAIFNINNDKILKGVSINNIEVADLTKQEAIDKLKENVEQKKAENINLQYEDFETSISLEQIEAQYNIEEAVNKAYEIGRRSNIILNNYEILKTKIKKEKIIIETSFNEEELIKQLQDISNKIPGAVTQSSYYIEDNSLIITKGKEGIAIKEADLKDKIVEDINSLETKASTITIPVEQKIPDQINLDAIYQEIHKEPQDAYYTTNPFKLYPHVDGVDFAISMEEAQKLLEEEKEEYAIPLKITKPKITTDQIGSEAFPDRLSTFSTKYDASNKARSTNLSLAAGKINGTVIMPGETFSYNKVVGERTIAAGYKEAKVYENGKVVDGLGGGICQISSTLYNSVLYANLEIVNRANHYFLTSYVGAGRDATVVYGAIDFKFRNNRKYPIKVQCSVKNGIAKIDIYGIKEETEYQVEIKTTVTGSIPYTTEYTDDATVENGKEVVKQKGSNGCKSETYKIVSLNGKVVSKTLLSKDTYHAMQRLIVRGTKGKQVPVTPPVNTAPTPEPTPAPDPIPEPEPSTNDVKNEIVSNNVVLEE